MNKTTRTLTAAGLLLLACGGTDGTTVGTDGTDPANQPPETNGGPNAPKPGEETTGEGGIVADLRADTNRDGVIRFDDPADDDGEDVWDAKHGAIFLANIDDDQVSCPKDGDDISLAKCNDAADDIVNGKDDELDLARLQTKPYPNAPDGATATLTWTANEKVRIFKHTGAAFTLLKSGVTLTTAELRTGIELAIEAKDIVRDPTEWDGYVAVTFKVDAAGESKTDKVAMRVSPLMTYHHLEPAETTYVSIMNAAGNAAMREDLAAASTAAGVSAPVTLSTQDQWTQDFFETGFMSMPGPNGKQHAIRVNIRSANESNPSSATSPLRRAGRVVFSLRGKDSAAVQEFDPSRKGRNDTLNSFGNLETIPPYTKDGKTYPLGRVLRGNIPTYGPDKFFIRMMEAQSVQPPVYVDTSWLLVGHVDETMSFVKAASPRGWVMLANNATMAKTMLETAVQAGNGNVPMFVGKSWDGQTAAQVTINQVLADTDVMSASAEAAAEVDGQLAIVKGETGLTDAEIVKIPYLHMQEGGASVAYQPGMLNGIYISDTHFVAPDPHGPTINGQDPFQTAMSQALAPYGVTVHFAEDWDTYHRNLGEVHCGTNATRRIPATKWWESGR